MLRCSPKKKKRQNKQKKKSQTNKFLWRVPSKPSKAVIALPLFYRWRKWGSERDRASQLWDRSDLRPSSFDLHFDYYTITTPWQKSSWFGFNFFFPPFSVPCFFLTCFSLLSLPCLGHHFMADTNRSSHSFFLPHPWHVEVPGPGIKPAPQQWQLRILNH